MTRKRIYITFMVVFLFFIGINFAIHVTKTNEFNQTVHVIDGQASDSECAFNIVHQNGKEVSWTRTATINGAKVDLNASSYEATFLNSSGIEVANWNMRIDIQGDCFLNAAWCGTVEIHQSNAEGERVQTLDLRNLDRSAIELTYFEDGDIYLFPLKKGDYLAYNPSADADEAPIPGKADTTTEAAIGFIVYYDHSTTADMSHFTVTYQYGRSYFQGAGALAFFIASGIWILLLVGGVSTFVTARVMRERAKVEATKRHNELLNAEVKARTKKILDMQQKVVLGLADMIENRDNNTGGHVKRTSDVVRILVCELQRQRPGEVSDEYATDIVRAAPMHDLGKIVIDGSVLLKPGKLTDEEFALMKTHSVKSGEIVRIILDGVEEQHFVETAYNIARFHHERWDGRGYPDGLKGEGIPLEARLMAIADVYDALVSKRCYKEPMSFEQADGIMRECMGTQFDGGLESVYSACKEEIEAYYKGHAE